MSLDVMHAFKENKISFIEAGTGIGKTFAYLVPAILWAEETGERVVISTNTIALQEQLIEKDIPFALKLLQSEIKVVVAKGMRNYGCLRKIDEEASFGSISQEKEQEELLLIQEWSKTTKTGARSDLPFFPMHATWEKVAVDMDACSHNKCPFFKDCFFFAAKMNANDAKIIVCNHHLLFADLAARRETENYDKAAVLPAFQRLILDEAHHIEDVATEYFAAKVTRLELLKIFSQLGGDSDKSEAKGKLSILKKKIMDLPDQTFSKKDMDKASLLNRLEMDIAGARREAISFSQDFFDSFISFLALFPSLRSDESQVMEQKMRLRAQHLEHPFWKERILPQAERLSRSIDRLKVSLYTLGIDLEAVKDERFEESVKSVKLDLAALTNKLAHITARLGSFLHDDTIKVRWIELIALTSQVDVKLVTADQDISSALRSSLFEKLSSTILCSATLATQKRFDYMKKRLGVDVLKEEEGKTAKISEQIYDSPFSYKTHALFGCPVDMPLPDDPKFAKSLAHVLLELIRASRGNAFILFTSYGLLKSSYDALYTQLKQEGYHPLRHGEDHRRELIRRFKETPRSVLFGTDSFWEGVDVVGDALRSVIITKLPFQVPSEPLIEARHEAIQARGGFPFVEYTVPKAIVKFKQAFGRLIRHKEDRGCVICLDARLVKKGYGKQFLQSLPECYQVFEPLDTLTAKMKEFYRGVK